ncbi:rhotekin-2-like isoform X1 [Tachypleus tridentatus]|uniref:rhotekin-2-like isoform X1 n=1 Tax=Tachypleus tridentatus TaxID=6853 RepID=UPI003FD0116A
MAPTLRSAASAPRKRRAFQSLPTFSNNFDYLRFLSDTKKKRLCKERTKNSSKTKNECDLEEKIDFEMKMKEGIMKLLAVSKHSIQTLEASKSLLTCTERIKAYKAEREHQSLQSGSVRQAMKSKGRISVSDIRMPLMWKDSDHFKNKGDYRRFAVFCLIKIGSKIVDTEIVWNVDRNVTDISFDSVSVFSQVSPDFEVRIEVYSHMLHNDLSIASTPCKIKRKITRSISRTVGRKLAVSLNDNHTNGESGPRFDLVAYATLRLRDVADSIKTHDLLQLNLEDPCHQLPLFGCFCCRLVAQPDFVNVERFAGYLNIIQNEGNASKTRTFWCSLKNLQLAFWQKCEDSSCKPPAITVAVNKDTKLETRLFNVINSFCFKIVNLTEEVMLAANTVQHHSQWISHIAQHIKEHDLWGYLAESVMKISSPFVPHVFRHQSLYEEA